MSVIHSPISKDCLSRRLQSVLAIPQNIKASQVWSLFPQGLSDETDREGVHLGDYVYEQDGEPLQHFPVQVMLQHTLYIYNSFKANSSKALTSCLWPQTFFKEILVLKQFQNKIILRNDLQEFSSFFPKFYWDFLCLLFFMPKIFLGIHDILGSTQDEIRITSFI